MSAVAADERGVLGRVRAANVRGPGERSLLVRVLVLVSSLVAAHAVLGQGVGGPLLRIGVYVGIPAGHLFSHLTRERTGLLTKAAIAVAMLMAVTQFVQALTGIQGDASAVQVPLAELFLWTLLLHSWDVPTRRDLSFSLVASLVLVGVAGTLSVSLAFALTLAAWMVPAFGALVLMHRSELATMPTPGGVGAPVPVAHRARAVAATAGVLGLILVLAVGVFALLPAAGGVRTFTFPMRLSDNVQVPVPGGLVNPSLGSNASPSGSGLTAPGTPGGRTTFGYFGFATQLDTSVRGRPDDTLVMRVRASAPDFWRGQSFDAYDGRTWTSTDDRPFPQRGAMPIDLPGFGALDTGDSERFVQTYYVVRPGPNIIFGAQSPAQLYFPDDPVYVLPDGSMRSGVLLDKGAIYTVVSNRPRHTGEKLQAIRFEPADGLFRNQRQRYLQLPDTLPQRVRDLADQLTAGMPSTYDKVKAIEDWLSRNTQYSLDIPPLPAGVDAVDHFLFTEKVGFCEQIGSSLVVLLRAAGVPARLTVGYTPGQRNPLTGLYEVKASDAHAWAEVWIPTAGWVSFDPTADVPLAGDTAGRRRAAEGSLGFLRGKLPTLPDGLVAGLQATAAGLGAATVVAGTVWLLRRRRQQAARPWVERWMTSFERAGARRGRPRAPTESARTYAEALGLVDDPRWAEVVDIVEREAFAGGASPPEREAAERAVDELRRRAQEPVRSGAE